MHGLKAIFRRELLGYFQTPVAYVFIAIFLLVSGAFTFYMGNFFVRGKADLEPFFMWHPWLYLFLVPAISMRLWSEERRAGTLELLMTLPVPHWQLVAGKFLAAWVFVALALACTFPMWLTVSYLGEPDHGVIVAGYVGSLLMAGGYLAIGSCLSACTRNQVIAFILSVTVCFMFTVSGFPLVIGFFKGWLPQVLVEVVSRFSFLTHFSDIAQGTLEAHTLFYFFSLMGLWLFLNVIVLEMKKG